MKKVIYCIAMVALAGSSLLSTTAFAQARVGWSINVGVPGSIYYPPASVIYEPRPVYVQPQPVYVEPPIYFGAYRSRYYYPRYWGYERRDNEWRERHERH